MTARHSRLYLTRTAEHPLARIAPASALLELAEMLPAELAEPERPGALLEPASAEPAQAPVGLA